MAPPAGAEPGSGLPPADPKVCSAPDARVWKLTPEQYTRTVQALMGTAAGRPGDELATTLAARKLGFSNEATGLDMSEPHVSALLQTARRLAGTITADAKLFPCGAMPDAGCVRTFVDAFGLKAFRRPLAPAELDNYLAFFTRQAQAHDAATAARLLVAGLLMSPSFVYRTELGPEGASAPGKIVTLTPYERASALSYFLTDGPPDLELMTAAKAGQIETKDQLAAHAKRLLGSAAKAQGLLAFAAELFDTQNARTVRKDTKVYPDWKPELGVDMARESDAFVQEVLWKEDARFATLMTAPFSMLTARLATLYGVAGVTATAPVRAMMPGNRAGLLLQGGLMSSLARENDTDPVIRGRFIREMLFCQQQPPPPPNVNAVPPPPDGKRTQRERLQVHSQDASCAGCHALMDPLGLGLEQFDGMGKYRTMDVGKPIDPSGTLAGVRPEGAKWGTGVDLVGLIARSPDALACFAKKTYEWGHGRQATGIDGCALGNIAARFEATGGNIIELAVAVASHDSFFTRRVPGP
jgi:hypothetical protein